MPRLVSADGIVWPAVRSIGRVQPTEHLRELRKGGKVTSCLPLLAKRELCVEQCERRCGLD